MACGCGKGTRAASAAGNYVYEFTPLDPTVEPKNYLTALEANRERRNAGGGTIRRVLAPTPATVPA